MKFIVQTTLVFFPFLLFGQNWVQASDFNQGPRTFFVDTIDNLLYIGGGFRFVEQDTFNGICYWNGSQFYPMGKGRKCGTVDCNPVNMVIRYQDEIYIGSSMDSIGGVYANGIAKWNGISWSAVGSEGLYIDENGGGWAFDSWIKDEKLFIVGMFRTAGGDTCNSVAHWDGNDWTGMNFIPTLYTSGVPQLFSVIYYKNEWYVGGNFQNEIDGIHNRDIARYDGVQWRQVGQGMKGGISWVEDMVIYKGELYVCGSFRKVDGNIGNRIMRWDGAEWKDVGGGMCNGYVYDMILYEDKLLAVGIFDCVSDLPIQNIAAWDGERWCSFGNSHFDNKIFCVTAYKGDIYIGGGFTEIDGQPVKYFAKWIGDHSTDTCSAPVVAAPEPQQEAAQLTVSPNPAYFSATLALEGEARSGKPVRFSIFNPLGQEVWSVTCVAGRQEVSLADGHRGLTWQGRSRKGA
jgi:hypothetical protein